MIKKTNLSAERQVLRDGLRDLEVKAFRYKGPRDVGLQTQNKNRVEAINEANRRLEQRGYELLSTSRVGGWFEKGSPAEDFELLWALVQVLLEWSGQPSASTLTGPAPASAEAQWKGSKELWKTRWEQARRTRSNAPALSGTPTVDRYLRAARNAARQHPYPGIQGDAHLPALGDLYVRQQARNHMSPESQATPAVPADEVFRTGHSISVLLAGPGGGKSTLLRTHLASSADCWLKDNVGGTVPVIVDAGALTGPDPLPMALARTTTRELKQFGLLEEITSDLFRCPPRAGVFWLVLVDGLDEIPDSSTRYTVMQTIINTVATEPRLYRFVVATRPLPAKELDTLGPNVSRFELQPFSRDGLLSYATKWFQSLEDPHRQVEVFMAGLERSRLHALARTPLMASMLCQLHLGDPSRPLPAGRAGAYQAFVELIYEQNSHKHVKRTHDQAIHHLKEHHQIPRDSQSAEQAAQQVRDHLPELIDHLAHERINGNTAPAVETLASHLHVNRPGKVKESLWNAFLSDLLRPTGLLTQHAGDLDFLHQTLLEYHAARHATRDEQARDHLLHDLIASSKARSIGHLEPPKLASLNPSYLGFILDRLLASQDPTTVATLHYLEDLTAHGMKTSCTFLVTQVHLRTNLPADFTATRLINFANTPTLNGVDRVRAVQALGEVEGYQNAGADQLARLADNSALMGFPRISAAEILTGLEGCRDAGADRLIRFAEDPKLRGVERVRAARALADVEGYRDAGADRLIRFAEDPKLDAYGALDRVGAARALADVEGYRDAGADRLIRFAEDPKLDVAERVRAARILAEVDGYRDAGAGQLTHLAEDPTVHSEYRFRAVQALSWNDEYREAGAALLARLAEDPTVRSEYRFRAVQALAGMAGYGEAGAALLARLAEDPAVDGELRVRAARALAGMAGYGEAGAALLARLAEDPAVDGELRVRAARALAGMAGYGEAGAALLARLAEDPALDGEHRVDAAQALTATAWYRDTGAALLTRLAQDPTLHGRHRVKAARALARVAGHQKAGAALLTRLAEDPALDGEHRVRAAQALTGLAGHQKAWAALLTRLAEDPALDGEHRVRAAQALTGLAGHQKAWAALLTRLAEDPALDGEHRVRAADALTGVKGHREAGAALLTRLAEDPALDGEHRVRAADALAKTINARGRPGWLRR